MSRFLYALVVIPLLLETGCMRYQPQYRPLVSTIDHDYSQTLAEKADTCAVDAETGEALSTCLEQYETLVKKDPTNYTALIALGNLYLLWGDGYVQSKSIKEYYFRRAMSACEQAMYLNERFRERIANGDPPWLAINVLTKQEVDAMVFWATAVFYYYKECLGPVGQALNFHWIQRAKKMLERAERLDPEWGGGIIPLSWGLYYLSLPEAVGGDREKSARYFRIAIAIGPNHPVNYWARAKYYHVKMGNRDAFLQDLQYVIDQDPALAEGHMAWKRFFINDAKELLTRVDQLFPK